MDVSEALELVSRIQEMIEDEISPERVNDFLEDVLEKSASVGETIESSGYVTEKQASALQNWHDAVERFL